MHKLRIAITGCGKVGHIHAAAVRSLPECELVAVCDVSSERADAFAARYGARGFTDLPTMFRDGGIEALLVCTPHPLHAEPTIRAAEAGVHVLVEKPMAA